MDPYWFRVKKCKQTAMGFDLISDLRSFSQQARQLLGPELLETPGGIFCSPTSSLMAGSIYVMGLNPGGTPNPNWLIGAELDLLENGGTCKNQYWDEAWGTKFKFKPGHHPFQRGMIRILNRLAGSECGARQVCTTNLIFKQSENASVGEIWKEVERYWAVHQIILQLVKPKLILAIGNGPLSPFSYLKNRAQAAVEETYSCSYPRLKLKAFRDEGLIQPRPSLVVGLPHVSRYSPPHRDLEWIERKYQEALALPDR